MPLQDTDAMLWFRGHLNSTEGDDHASVIIRFTRPRRGEACLTVDVGFSSEGNEGSARSTTPTHNSGTPRNPAQRTSPEAIEPRSPAPARFGGKDRWRLELLTTDIDQQNSASPHEAQQRLESGVCEKAT